LTQQHAKGDKNLNRINQIVSQHFVPYLEQSREQ